MSELEKLYKDIATDVWDRMKFALETNSKISETTLTENLLFMINKYRSYSKDNSIRIYESKDEKANGNDLEIYLEISKNKYILLVIQAKKLYTKEQKYKAINHKIGTNYQIDLLENYANSKNGLALYLLYNFAPDCIYENKEYFGCTLIEALQIKKNYYPKSKHWKIPSFNDLHKCNARLHVNSFRFKNTYLNFSRYGLPWHFLANNKYFEDYVNYYNEKNLQRIKEYMEDEIVDHKIDEWIEIGSGKVGDEDIEVEKYNVSEKVTLESTIINEKNLDYEEEFQKRFFKPKFKMLIGLEKDNELK